MSFVFVGTCIKQSPKAAKIITIKNQKNYEKNFTFLMFVAISNELRHAKKRRFPRGKCTCVLQW
jgi:hypothetical protein